MRGVVVVALVFCGFQLLGSVFGRLCGEGKGFAWSGAFVSVLVRTVERSEHSWSGQWCRSLACGSTFFFVDLGRGSLVSIILPSKTPYLYLNIAALSSEFQYSFLENRKLSIAMPSEKGQEKHAAVLLSLIYGMIGSAMCAVWE